MFAASDPDKHRSSIIAVNHTGSITGLSVLSPMSAITTATAIPSAAAPFVIDPSVPVDLDEAYICVGIMRAAMNCVQQYTEAEEAGTEAVSEQAAQVNNTGWMLSCGKRDREKRDREGWRWCKNGGMLSCGKRDRGKRLLEWAVKQRGREAGRFGTGS